MLIMKSVVSLAVASLVGAAACGFHPVVSLRGDAGLPDARDASRADVLPEGGLPDVLGPDRLIDAEPDGPVCTTGRLECVSAVEARACRDGRWEPVECFLGCDLLTGACYVPSNVDVSRIGSQEDELGELAFGSGTWVVDGDRGTVASEDGSQVLRPRDAVNQVAGGVGFYILEQEFGDSQVAVFVMAGLQVPVDALVRVLGRRPVIFLVTGDARLLGRIDAGADGAQGGPGGGRGGDPGLPGRGPCPGQPGRAVAGCPKLCTSGSGGGGFGGAGGAGADIGATDGACFMGGNSISGPGGSGGGICGNELLVPLVGGSGGAGGVPGQDPSTQPGPGGGGGGAFQLSVRGTLTLTGGILAPGAGGGPTVSGGGAGGGSGGAILLEARVLESSAGCFLAANGGGGGAGDCT